jgi:hypothetical protein
MDRVYFDANDGSIEFGYLLHFDQSVADLNKLGDRLRAGTEVTIYDSDGLEMDGVLMYDDELRCWKAIPNTTTIRYPL